MKRFSTATAVLIAAIAGAAAQTFPSRVITIVVPLPPGGATDTLTRTLADHMKNTLGQTIVVENMPGAGGTLAVGRVARAPGDGYTLSVGNWATHMASAATYTVQYDILKDLEPVAKLADTPLWIVTKKALPVNDLKELIAWIKAYQDKVSAGIVGQGSGGHICGLTFQNATGTRYQFIPYRGGAPAMQDLVGGQIDFMCDMAANSLPQARAGNIRPMAVMSKTRWFAAPDVPTAEEMGLPGVAISLWHGLWASKGSPRTSLPSSTARWSLRSRTRRCKRNLPTRAMTSRRASSRRRRASPPIIRPRPRSGGPSSRAQGSRRNNKSRRQTAGATREG